MQRPIPLSRLRAALHRPEAGQAMIEYLVVTAVVAAALFVPFQAAGNMSLADYLARAVRAFFRAYSYLLSTY